MLCGVEFVEEKRKNFGFLVKKRDLVTATRDFEQVKPVKQRFPPPANQTRDAMEKRGGKTVKSRPLRHVDN